MNWTELGIVASFLWTIQLVAYFAWLAGAHRRKRLTAAQKANMVVFFAFAMVATVEAQKNNATNDPPRRAAAPRRQTRSQGIVGETDIARGYVLESELSDETFQYFMPTNATSVGRWHVHGAASPFGRNMIELDGFSFPLGPDHERFSSFWFSPNATLRTSPHDPFRQIRAAGGNLFAAGGVSRLWRMAHDGALTLCWERLLDAEDTNTQVNAAITLFENGDFETRSNSVLRTYRRINPDDWDGDGIPNRIDLEPTVSNGNLYGTSEAWYNAACGNVLHAQTDTNGEVSITWNTNACAEAYYWLAFTSSRGPNRVDITCDGASNLGDVSLIAASNQNCRVPLLIGAEYHVVAQFTLDDIEASDEDAEITIADASQNLRSARGGLRRGSGPSSSEFWVSRPVEIDIHGECPGFSLATSPYVGATLSSVTGGCCSMPFDNTNLTWTCDEACHCSGYSHSLSSVATWEGYSRTFAWAGSCDCQEVNKTDPSTWFSVSVPPLLIKLGNPHTVSAHLETPVETNAEITLSCIAGGNKIQIIGNQGNVLTVIGAAKSDSIDDVVFEATLNLDGTIYRKTQALTVAEVKYLHMTSDVAAGSVSPPPFDGESVNAFTPYGPGSPGKHLLVPFNLVVDESDFSIADFSVDLRLELDPDVGASTGASATWTVEENTVQSGDFMSLGGLSARFSNPKRGGIVRFSAVCDGSSPTKGTLLLPLAGASVDGVLYGDFQASRVAAQRFESSWARYLLTPVWGAWCFYFNANGDYIGRVDSSARPTVWRYNQIDDESGLGAVATLNGLPIRMSKLSNFLVSTTLTSIDVNEMLRRMSIAIGTLDDPSAAISWAAGSCAATNGNFSAVAEAMAITSWRVADEKVQRLWPNAAPTDNHVPRSYGQDLNRVFFSPGFIDKWGRSDN